MMANGLRMLALVLKPNLVQMIRAAIAAIRAAIILAVPLFALLLVTMGIMPILMQRFAMHSDHAARMWLSANGVSGSKWALHITKVCTKQI